MNNQYYEVATIIWRKNMDEPSPAVILQKGIRMDSFDEKNGILNFSPTGTIPFEREKGAVIERGTLIFKVSIIGSPKLYIPHAQFGKAIYTPMLILVTDSDSMFPTLTMDDFHSSIEEDNVFASKRNSESVKWILYILRLGKSFAIGEHSFENHDGVLEKI